MKRTPLIRKTPLRANPEKTKAWKNRSQKRLPARSPKRRREEVAYGVDRTDFLRDHPICPVTGLRTSDIHHSAKRTGKWLNLKRYWIAVSRAGHKWIEDNSEEAEAFGLMIRLNPSITYEHHVAFLKEEGISLDGPLFYKSVWCGATGPILPTSYVHPR